MNKADGLPPPPGSEDNAATVTGRALAPTPSGFGQLWHKELSVVLGEALSPEEVLQFWKEHLEELWPDGGEIYRWSRDLAAGDLVGIDLTAGPIRLSTAGCVMESGATHFTLVPPEGHVFAGWIRFETAPHENSTRASVVIRVRASDPLYELCLVLGGHRKEERFWAQMLSNLAARFGQRPKVRLVRRRMDASRQWRKATNIRDNASLKTTMRRARKALLGPS